MVEIRYGEHYEMADLAGRSIAQAREQYKQEFGIPDKAQARLNSEGIRQKHEPKTALGDNDSLTFAEKSRKGLFFIGAILLALAITGGIFAYGATTITVGLDLTARDDFAAVTAATPPTWDVWGNYKGSVDTGDLFTVTPDVPGGWTGDMSIVLTLTNAHELVAAYRILVLEIEIWDSAVQWEVTVAPVGAGDDATITITYTNQDSVTGQTATAIIGSGALLGDIDIVDISPDTGIQDITGITLTGWTGATAGQIDILGGGVTLGTIDYTGAFTDGATITPVQVGTTEYLTMSNGEISFEIDQTGLTAPYAVKLTNGFYITHRGGWTTNAEDPSIFCQVLQRSAP